MLPGRLLHELLRANSTRRKPQGRPRIAGIPRPQVWHVHKRNIVTLGVKQVFPLISIVHAHKYMRRIERSRWVRYIFLRTSRPDLPVFLISFWYAFAKIQHKISYLTIVKAHKFFQKLPGSVLKDSSFNAGPLKTSPFIMFFFRSVHNLLIILQTCIMETINIKTLLWHLSSCSYITV